MNNNFSKKYGPYFYILPSMVFLSLIFVFPMIQNLVKSFYRTSFDGGKSVFYGFNNYIFLLTKDFLTRAAAWHNVKLLMLIPMLLVLSIFFSVILSGKIRGAKIYQTFMFAPYIISIVVVGVVFSRMLRFDGIINLMLTKIGLGMLAKDWFGRTQYALYAIIVVILWRELPFGIILFSAGIRNIDESIYEAAKIDGANWLQTVFHITIPQLKGIINFYVIYNIMMVFAWMFTYVFVMTKGGPGNSTTILELQIYNLAFKKYQVGMASALSILLFITIFIFIYFQFRFRTSLLEER
ncbi:MAG: sugar ABC transporter permease [Spirochaetota bacterium]|nr:MAG: sugar ABC transporter permease [Spirochaetota bacterium]